MVGESDSIPTKLNQYYGENASFFAYDYLFSLSIGLSDESKAAIDYAAACIISCEDKCQCPELTNYTQYHKTQWTKEFSNLKVDIDPKLPEVLYFEHGLRFASQKLKDYVANKVFLDIGAFTGDSIYALSFHRPSKIYSYEIGLSLYQTVLRNVKKFGLENITVVHNKGISDKPGTMHIANQFSAGLSLSLPGGNKVSVVTIDNERSKYKLKVSFITADVEGFALKVLEGARTTIKEDRPVLQISVYHNYYEFFLVREFIRQFPNYIIDFHSENDCPVSMGEVSIFAYPAEIEYEVYKQSPFY